MLNLPPIHYISLKESIKRRENLHKHFDTYNIVNFTPHIFERLESINDFNIIGDNINELTLSFLGAITSHFTVLKRWYENTTESVVLICEDDLSLETVKYWNFTWEEFESSLPKDWNCIQLVLIREYDCDDYQFQKRDTFDWCAAAYLINRKYVKYLLDTYYYEDFLDLSSCKRTPLLEHILFSDKENIYCFPLFLEDCVKTESTMIHPYRGDAIEDGQRINHYKSYYSALNWWKENGKNLSLSQIMNASIKHEHIYQESQFGEDWFSYPNLYKSMVEKFPSGSKFVEIGSWKGKSAAFMAVEIANSDKDIEFTCIDTWEGSVEHAGMEDLQYLYDIFSNNMKPLEKYYTPLRMPSLIAVEQFEDHSLDFVFIDASHEYEDVKKDIAAWIKKVKPGGVIAGHDYYINDYDYFPGVKQAVNESFADRQLQFSEDCWIYYVEPSLSTLIKFSKDTKNAQLNFDLALEYDKIGHTASAISFYLRAAELSEDLELSYISLLRMGLCFERQGNRNQTVTGLYKQAISCLPKRPEAYYLLSKNYTNNNLHHEAYTMIEIATSIIDPKLNTLSYDVEYPGYHGLIYQKAISSWWWGKKQESRDLFKLLFQNYWDVLDENSKSVVIYNISRLGYTSNTQSTISYDKSKHSSLRYHFTGSDQIERNHSQVYQDMFVLSMLNGKRNGTFLEVGSAHSYYNNNTALLESKFDWSGVAIELKKDLADEYSSTRKSKILNVNALELDYKKLLDDNFNSNVIDYLQLDIEPAKNTYEVLLKIPLDDYKFAVITYEHDHYVDETKQCRNKSREYLKSKGYVLVVNDISADGISTFEDWWIHPDLIDKSILSIMTDVKDDPKKIDDYFLTPSTQLIEFNMKINSNTSSTCWIVDNFYEDPDSVRKFALSQDYIEGGFGRGFIGRRTEKQFLFPGLKEKFEEIMGQKITAWEEHGMNGRFQNCHAGEPLVYHCDSQRWGGMLYLTPDAPYQCGTTLYANKKTRARTYYEEGWDDAWKDGTHLDGTPFEQVDVLGNVYNRLVIFDASCIHSASEYFGSDMKNSRLWQMFFFDT